MDLPGVPETITRSALDALIATLGLPSDHLISLNVGYRSIEAEFVALNVDGAPYRSPSSEHIATHRISIPVIEG